MGYYSNSIVLPVFAVYSTQQRHCKRLDWRWDPDMLHAHSMNYNFFSSSQAVCFEAARLASDYSFPQAPDHMDQEPGHTTKVSWMRTPQPLRRPKPGLTQRKRTENPPRRRSISSSPGPRNTTQPASKPST